MPKEKDDFVKVRKGIFEHLTDKRITEIMLVAYMVLLDECDWPTGVWHGSAIRLARRLGWCRRKAQGVLRDLASAMYITSKYVSSGENEEYDILINNYTPPDVRTTVRMRPVKAGRGVAKKSNTSSYQKLPDPLARTRVPLLPKVATKYSDLESTDILSEGDVILNTKHLKRHQPKEAGAASVSQSHYDEILKRNRPNADQT